ncbi:MAG TPA: RidA family protein [Candidatus Limnocylindrales bacterium]|nr:RidA family protein [Candidatus Limnocylindrales bacterium]
MISDTFTRRNFAVRLAPVFSALGLAAILPKDSFAKASKHEDMGVKKLNEEGKPNEGNSFIMPIVIHNGVAYIAGQGAHDTGPAESWEIGAHTTKVMDKIKKLVEAAGSTMDDVLQLSVFLTKIEHYDGMNNVFKTYFPKGGPARTTVAVAALPGNSLVEINCIAAVTKK